MPEKSNATSEPASASASHKPAAASSSSASTAPPGHAIRRSFTVDETRKRPPLNHSSSGDFGFDGPRRRSSNFTDYSLGEARDILNPKAGSDDDFSPPESSSLASISLAFALLPAIAGALFKNGSLLVTDLMLLGLSGIFLHWSVTQPWTWYHAAQEVRMRHESNTETAIEEDSDFEEPGGPGSPLDDVPEEEDETRESSAKKAPREPSPLSAEQRSALRELYIYEFLALVACFALPLLAAYLLHTIRAQLSRPSEGLVSNYNLTIFCLVSELRVFSHMFKLVQSRTLHLQRIVHRNPYGSGAGISSGRLNEILERLEKLEARPGEDNMAYQKNSDTEMADKWKQEAAMIREVRNGIQPELDALNRAVRRYEKKATLLQMQTESRFGTVDARLEDAIALAAAAAKNSVSHRSRLTWLADTVVRALLFPFHTALQILLLPVKMVSALVYRRSRGEPQVKAPRSRSSKMSGQTRYNGDRVPVRVAKR